MRLSVTPTSGPVTGGTKLTVTGPYLPGSLQLDPNTLHSTRDARVFVTDAVDAPRIVPIHVVVPTQNGTQVMDIGQYFTYGKIPSIGDIHPRALTHSPPRHFRDDTPIPPRILLKKP
ncbi:hypothetical protein CAPTEDRAFT_185171 [Capitella teleta]|uniref:IPT/TIG domain-containing protein n=1 Tax=Capitella teleta TaxID=283909 RepID=R7UCM6_CAPTE|nr:hypothetical protein CAPTEDRAFT_185171 [Capitella teleta]|eukprot:ELU03749.1 hypothetical protein CAPTEDRAFT_185171 [Capitella teleta]